MNPYRIAEKAGRAIGLAFSVCVAGLLLAAIVYQLIQDGWGWNALWLIPGVPVGLALLALACGMMYMVCTWAEDKWHNAKAAWDNREYS